MNKQGFLGIDVSKGYADFILLDKNKTVREKTFRLNDTVSDHKQLGVLVDKWLTGGLDAIFCGLESTGGYENNWYNYLQGLGQTKAVKVSRLNARAVKSVGDAALRRTITDQVSAENVAIYLVCFPEKVHYSGDDRQCNSAVKDSRSYYKFIEMLQKQKVQITNQLEKLLYEHFPQLLIYCRHGIPAWLLRMLSLYPSADTVKKAGIKRLQKIKGITAGKATSLLNKINGNSQPTSDTISYTITSMAREIVDKEEQIKQHKFRLAKSFTDNEEVKLLQSMPGIAIDSAVGLMIEIDDINRFDTCKKLCAFFGVHPTFKQSGDGKWGSHMSKKGRPAVRKILYMSSLTAIRWNPSIKELYARKRSDGFNHYEAMGVIMHKLLRVIYGMLKNKSAFNLAIDDANKQKSLDKQDEKKQDQQQEKKKKKSELFRFEEPSLEAPISRQAAGRIKKQMTSQTQTNE